MRQTVTPGYIPDQRKWFWCVCSTGYPTKLLLGNHFLPTALRAPIGRGWRGCGTLSQRG